PGPPLVRGGRWGASLAAGFEWPFGELRDVFGIIRFGPRDA
ncbi:MAG: hypothetical protein RIR70_628, partial [Pseudomonadota bacterium]